MAAPLARTEEIVLLGGSDTTSGEITRLVGQVPPAVQALTGVDLSKVCSSGLGHLESVIQPSLSAKSTVDSDNVCTNSPPKKRKEENFQSSTENIISQSATIL